MIRFPARRCRCDGLGGVKVLLNKNESNYQAEVTSLYAESPRNVPPGDGIPGTR